MNPGAAEVCNGGFGDDSSSWSCVGVKLPYDCDDTDPDVSPTATACESRCSGLQDGCATPLEGPVLFAIHGSRTWSGSQGLVVGDYKQGDNGLLGYFAQPAGSLELTDADLLVVSTGGQLGAERSLAVDLLHDDGLVDLVIKSPSTSPLLPPFYGAEGLHCCDEHPHAPCRRNAPVPGRGPSLCHGLLHGEGHR